MRIAICDDENIFGKELKQILDDFYKSLDVFVDTFCSGKLLLKELENKEYDLIFLDIEMPEIDGFEVARNIRNNNYHSAIIFLTSHTEMAMEGYEVDAFRFLEKPLKKSKLLLALQDFEKMQSNVKKIAVAEDGMEKYIECRDIISIKSDNVYLEITTTKQSLLIRKKMKDILKELPSEMFMQVHRSYIVNLEKVSGCNGDSIIMKNNFKIPVSKKHKENFKINMMRYIREKI